MERPRGELDAFGDKPERLMCCDSYRATCTLSPRAFDKYVCGVASVMQVEVFPRLEDIGIGYEGSFGRALTRVLNGEREVASLHDTRNARSSIRACVP